MIEISSIVTVTQIMQNNNFSSFMRGRQNILAFNLPENNSDSPEVSGWRSVIQRAFTKAYCPKRPRYREAMVGVGLATLVL